MDWFLTRLKEPSTAAGIALAAQAAATSGQPWWVSAIMAIGGASAVLMREGKH